MKRTRLSSGQAGSFGSKWKRKCDMMIEIVVTAVLLMIPCVIAALLLKHIGSMKTPLTYSDEE